MGWYTAVVIVAACGENMDYERRPGEDYNEHYWIDRINEQADDPYWCFRPYNAGDGDGSWGGGLQSNMCQSSAKHLHLDEFIPYLAALPWREPNRVQIFLKDEHDEKWSLHDYPFPKILTR